MSLLIFFLSQNTYTFTANAQIWPRTLNGLIRGSNNYIYLVINDLGRNVAGARVNFLLGYAFLERFYTVFDIANRVIGIATTQWTTATINDY